MKIFLSKLPSKRIPDLEWYQTKNAKGAKKTNASPGSQDEAVKTEHTLYDSEMEGLIKNESMLEDSEMEGITNHDGSVSLSSEPVHIDEIIIPEQIESFVSTYPILIEKFFNIFSTFSYLNKFLIFFFVSKWIFNVLQ